MTIFTSGVVFSLFLFYKGSSGKPPFLLHFPTTPLISGKLRVALIPDLPNLLWMCELGLLLIMWETQTLCSLSVTRPTSISCTNYLVGMATKSLVISFLTDVWPKKYAKTSITLFSTRVHAYSLDECCKPKIVCWQICFRNCFSSPLLLKSSQPKSLRAHWLLHFYSDLCQQLCLYLCLHLSCVPRGSRTQGSLPHQLPPQRPRRHRHARYERHARCHPYISQLPGRYSA